MTDGPDEVYRRGMRTRREVLGDAHVDRAVAGTTDLTADFQALITRYAWGEVWDRPGLDRPVRRLVTIAVLAALGRDGELAMHVRAALDDPVHPVPAAEVGEVLLQVALYAGLPAANHAFEITGRVLAERQGS